MYVTLVHAFIDILYFQAKYRILFKYFLLVYSNNIINLLLIWDIPQAVHILMVPIQSEAAKSI
jgi:hypothetical protein